LAASAEADQAMADAERARAQAANLQGQLQAARRSLLVLLGRGGEPSADLPVEPVLADPVEAPAALPASLLTHRPDVLEAREQLASALGKLKLDELALLPTVQLTGALTPSRLVQTGFSATTIAASGGGALLVPIFSRPKLMAEVHAQGARADEAVVSYEKAVQTAYGEAENALAQSAQDRTRLAELERSEAAARHAFDATSALYKAGIDSLTDALLAEQTWRSGRSELTSARIDALRRSVTLFKALGGGWSPALAQGRGFSPAA
jgi:outer membrane protein TolC